MKPITTLYQLLLSALADFRRDKVRTILTSLGIMIGVMSVVMLIALGIGLRNYIQNQFSSLGANLIMVLPGSGFGGGGSGAGFGPGGLIGGVQFDTKDVTTVQRVANIKYVVPVFMTSSLIESENEKKSGYVMAANEQFFQLMNSKVLTGRLFEKTDLNNRSKSGVLGYILAQDLFTNAEDALGKTVRIEGVRIKVIGVNQKTGDNEQDHSLVIPYTTAFDSIDPQKTFFALYLGVSSADMVKQVTADVKTALEKRYKPDKFSVTEQSQLLSSINQIFAIINLVLVAIGSISLVVGGIGIMNIMYATVTERTREVGIRRAIGATKRDILLHFLVEAVVLSVLGGALGLLLAAGIILIVRIWFPMALDLMAVIIAFGVSSAIGIFFGVFPAKKAADLSPIDAIRYE
ncbi:MAG TPA: ABC transporter permease [Patescibacteria group bacterium]